MEKSFETPGLYKSNKPVSTTDACTGQEESETLDLAAEEESLGSDGDDRLYTLCCGFFDGEEMKEELLTLVGVEGETTGQATYDALVKRLDKMKIPLHKCISVTTDGTPAMGLLYLWKFFKESDGTYEDLLTYNNIRWLSKGNALSRLRSIRQELTSFLYTCASLNARQFPEMMSSFKNMSDLTFLFDICGYLNDLNLKLQGKNKTIINTLPAVPDFSHKLELFLVDVKGDMLHFPTLKAFLEVDEEMESCTAEHTHFIEKLKQEFSNRFS
ncbi:general transcription factor II-I repeat domain-containing protein 2-like [Watersipora subatra]|uniref:general transcription factor II-I repeat domain-containing protein 2-like n=1 Tax=Watersipora subatra TaxID=2589382 RepID=UPI00355C230C